jgi:hypothetical protein
MGNAFKKQNALLQQTIQKPKGFYFSETKKKDIKIATSNVSN